MRDTLPKKSKKIECLILNQDVSQSIGSHWCAITKIGNFAWYFDSFGNLLPPLEVKTYLGGNVKLFLNYNRYQKDNTVICGHLCLQFLHNFWKNINKADFV